MKPGKGGAFVRTTLRNVRTGAVVDRTFRAGEKVEQAIIDKREMQFLYRDGDDYVFMDNEHLRPAPRAAGRARRGRQLPGRADRPPSCQMYERRDRAGRDRPASVELAIAETEPGMQGDRVSGARKPATLETGLVVQVPLFVNPGDRVKVDTRTGEYITAGLSLCPTTSCGEDAVRRPRAGARPAVRGRDEGRRARRGPGRPAGAAGDDASPTLVEGVERTAPELDELIAAHARDWTLERMPAIDRDAAAHGRSTSCSDRPDVPTAVVIDEAVELAKRFSTDDSGRFVNGMLSAIAAEAPPDARRQRRRPTSATSAAPTPDAALLRRSCPRWRPPSAWIADMNVWVRADRVDHAASAAGPGLGGSVVGGRETGPVRPVRRRSRCVLRSPGRPHRRRRPRRPREGAFSLPAARS